MKLVEKGVEVATREGDRQVLAALAAHGSDLRKAAHIVHYLYFRSRDSAESASAALRSAGYTLRPLHPTRAASLWKRLFGPHEFSCIAETHAVPSEEAVFAATDRMSAIAARFGGEYDGWESSIEK